MSFVRFFSKSSFFKLFFMILKEKKKNQLEESINSKWNQIEVSLMKVNLMNINKLNWQRIIII